MTNEQAIEVLNGHIKDSSVAYGTFTGQALRMAIEALKAQLSKEGTTSDTISRQAAINEIDEWIKAFLENGHKESAADARLIQDGIIQLPSAQPKYEPVKAEDFAKTMSENTIYGFTVWYGTVLELIERQGFAICKKTM